MADASNCVTMRLDFTTAAVMMDMNYEMTTEHALILTNASGTMQVVSISVGTQMVLSHAIAWEDLSFTMTPHRV
jgi:hypothetical protein